MRILVLKTLILPLKILARVILFLDRLPGPIADISLISLPLSLLFITSLLAPTSGDGLTYKILISPFLAISIIMLMFSLIAALPLILLRFGVFGKTHDQAKVRGVAAFCHDYRIFLAKLIKYKVEEL
jgi:hypothetical protein